MSKECAFSGERDNNSDFVCFSKCNLQIICYISRGNAIKYSLLSADLCKCLTNLIKKSQKE